MLKISERLIGNVTILSIDGRIVLGEESVCLREKIRALMSIQKKLIILNLGNITFIDSAGNGTVVAAHHSVKSQGGVLKLCHLPIKLQEVWQINRLLTVFDTYDTEADAIKSFGFPLTYCLCPVCRERSGPSFFEKPPSAQLTCGNSKCGAQFMVSLSQSSENQASVNSLSFQTYEKEHFQIVSGAPFKLLVVGRLDLFSSSALQKCWQALPSPRRVLINLNLATEINDTGRKVLLDLLAGEESGSKIAVSLEGLSQEYLAAFPDGPPFYRHLADALRAMGDVSDTPRWLARISEESRLPA